MDALQTLKAIGFRSVSIPITKGKWTIVDLEDAGNVLQHRWQAHQSKKSKTVYAKRIGRDQNGKEKVFEMHRELMGFPAHAIVDHRDGDGLNNRRIQNLRLSNRQESAVNKQLLRQDNKSGFKGVTWHKTQHLWCANIRVNKKLIYLGRFGTPEDAAAAYDAAAKKYFGEFAAPNDQLRRSN